MLSRRTLILSALAGAAVTGLGLPAPAWAAEEPGAFIEKLADNAIATMATKGLSGQERVDRFRTLFVASFDLPEISRFVLGRHWKMATPEQQKEFMELFEEISIYTWVGRFKDYGGETLKVTEVKPDGERGFFVHSDIIRPGQQPLPVIWRVRKREQSLMITDIIVEGVSMAITNRSDYSSVMQAQGGNIDGLFKVMRAKLEKLKAEQR